MEPLPYKSIQPHLKNLRYFGFYQIKSKSKIRLLLQTIYMRIILILILLFTVQQIMKVYQVRDDVNKVMDTMFLLLTNSDFIYKQVILWQKHDQIEEILDILKNPLFDPTDAKHRAVLVRTAREAVYVLRAFNITALTTCLLWVLYPTILYAQSNPVEFAIWLPFDANQSPQFYYTITYVWFQTSWLAFGNTTMDTFISFFFAQCKTQLAILRLNLEEVVDKSEIEAEKLSKPFVEIYRHEFRKILSHYNLIVSLCYKTQDIFGGSILYLFLISGWIICTSMYRLTDVTMTFVTFSSMVMYISCILVEIFLYCHFGNEVAYESEQLLISAYALDWNNIPLEYRRALIIFMERIKRSISPTAGLLIPLSNNTFVSIMRSSYTFYTFLKNTNNAV